MSAIIPSYGYSVADDTPFTNQVFDPDAVDDHFFGSDGTREAFWKYHRNTNYSVVDEEVIRDLFRRKYEDEVRKSSRLDFIRLARIERVLRNGPETRILLHSLLGGTTRELDVDALVCATGYDAMEPTGLLTGLGAHLPRERMGRYRIERDYRLATTLDLPGAIYLQGGTEHTHGLTSSLLSNAAVRSGEIAESIVHRLVRGELAYAVALPAS